MSWAPRLRDARFLDGDELASPEEVADDFSEWGLRVDGRWARVATTAQPSAYENMRGGEIAVHSADNLKEGRLRLRTLAPDMESFLTPRSSSAPAIRCWASIPPWRSCHPTTGRRS
ncbi:hypothetical protein [Phytomonospora endophytica]|uniref:Uncharacterized protein n=1 Tax=Phytomonospora endophytica TaxID=714109 RepID=A0A841FBZ8_9ACTN|nr:hypothetical protein [Phytomonospora endophytica]MBB6032905.1 hypothetical protein [Phytomonospora endophytica]GIG65131.1 hypothetical protein Pen01_14260 [Phytomonospora endophytica]